MIVEPHIHSGFVVFLTVGVYAVLFIWLMRFAAGWLATYPPTEKIGTALGGVVNFG